MSSRKGYLEEMKIKLWKFPLDMGKVENWLNQMSANGLNFVGLGFWIYRYDFEQGEPGEYTYSIISLDESFSHPKSIQYLCFLKENKIECVSHAWNMVFLRKKVSDGRIDLFTDKVSQVQYNRKMLSQTIRTTIMVAVALVVFAYFLIVANLNSLNGIGHLSIFNPLFIIAYIIYMVNLVCLISSVRQCRRYVLRIKELDDVCTFFE